MTVQELIDLLSAVEDKTQKVWLEGCDCFNPASGAEQYTTLYEEFPVLLINADLGR